MIAAAGPLERPILHGARVRSDGSFDALDAPVVTPSLAQRVFRNEISARIYVITREGTFARIVTHRSHAHDAAWLVRALALRDDARVLDVPCGQGNLTEAVARAVPRGRVVAVDLSDTMLMLARKRLQRAGCGGRTVLVRADAQQLPMPDGSMDAVSACGGLHIFPDPDRAIAEMRRVLRTGGRVAGLAFVRRTDLPRRLAQSLIARFAGMRAFDFDELGHRFQARGFAHWQWHMSGILGYFDATAA
jgi:SAM-dependent methyltransferase